MTIYKDFHRDVIKRSKINLENYKGDYEVTMLLNTLYMTLLHAIELRTKLHVKSKLLVKYLKDEEIVDMCENNFDSDEIIRNLRNGLAHLNIRTNSKDEKTITGIIISSKNNTITTKCKECGNKNSLNKNYNEDDDGYICNFKFSIEQLRELTYLVIDSVLKDNESKETENAK